MTLTEPLWKTTLAHALSLLGVLATLALITSISFEAFSNAPFMGDSPYAHIQLGVCLYFLLDSFLLFLIAPNRLRFFGRNLVLIILSVPYAWLVDKFTFEFSSQTLYVIHLLPIVRGGLALAVLVRMLVSNRISGLFVVYVALFFAVAYFQTLMFYVFEANTNPQVKSYADVLWWASMTVTTVGSNILPVTTIGKICAATLAVVGMTIFPILTAYVTTLVHNFNEREKINAAKKALPDVNGRYT